MVTQIIAALISNGFCQALVPIILSGSDACEHCERLILDTLELPLSKARRPPFCERVQLVDRIGAQIHFGGLKARVSKPERDLSDISGRFESVERARVTQHVGRDLFRRDRRHAFRGGCRVQVKPSHETAPLLAVAHHIEEEMQGVACRPDGQSFAQFSARLLPQRQGPFASASSDDDDLVEGRPLQTVERKPNQFRDPQFCVVGETQHRPVSDTGQRA